MRRTFEKHGKFSISTTFVRHSDRKANIKIMSMPTIYICRSHIRNKDSETIESSFESHELR